MGFVREVKSTGRPAIEPKLLVAAWVYAYMTKQKSTRGLERACKCDMGAIWLTGNLQPDHSTLGSFFKDHRASFKQLLKQSALLGCKMGMVDLSFVAVDGSKLRASDAFREAIKSSDLKFGLAALDEEIERYVAEVEAAGNSPCAQLPESLSETKALRDALERDLEELQRLGTSLLSPVDPDARMMQTRDGIRPAYNGQAAVDSNSGIVIACQVSQCANDLGLLDGVLDEVESNLGMNSAVAAADSGYCCGEQIRKAQDKKREVALGTRGVEPGPNEPFHSWFFVHDLKRDVLVCPVGGELPFQGMKYRARRYHCYEHTLCPFAKDCSKDPEGRSVVVGPDRSALLQLWERQKIRDHKADMKKRSATVERVFGHVKRSLNLRLLEHRGLEMIEAVWSTVLCATNLATLYRVWAAA